MTPLIITGCQRSGTAWASVVLSASGWWCGHERHIRDREPDPMPDHVVEASWMAPAWGLGDVLLLRDPLAVASSMHCRSVLSRPQPSGRFAYAHLPGLEDVPYPDRLLEYWVRWNRMAARTTAATWRLADMSAFQICETLEASGRTPDYKRVEAALGLVGPQNVQPGVEPMNPAEFAPRLVEEARWMFATL